MKRSKLVWLMTAWVILAFVLVSCGSETATPATEPAEEAAATTAPATAVPATEVPATTAPEPPAGERVQVRWFVGLGAGSDEPTFAPQQAVVDQFNASQDEIELVLEIVANATAYDALATQIAGGNPPDLVGPVGIRGRDTFKGAWLDLQPLMDAANYDLSDFDPAMVDFYRVQEEGQLGIPFAIFPSFVLFNKDLFDEAGLAYPPQVYGEPYVDADGNSREWNMDTLRELAIELTVDGNGNTPTDDGFDNTQIVQFGFMNQWTDPRGVGTFFGPGSLVAEDGTAQIPAAWEAAWRWTYQGWWEDWFIPNGPYGGAEFLQGPGGPFSSGNLAMMHNHLWYVAPWAMGGVSFAWDMAATPSYEGTVTSKMHADTFGILKSSKNPQAAFEVLTYLLGPEVAPELLNIYGGMPARISLQKPWLDNYFETNFPGQAVNKQVVIDSMEYADNPNHESYMPSFLETTDRYNEFWNRLSNEPGLDFDAELEQLKTDLQAIFSAAAEE